MVSWDEKEFDKQANALTRRITADSYTSEEIANLIFAAEALDPNGWDFNVNDRGVHALIAQAVRMARGDEEIQ